MVNLFVYKCGNNQNGKYEVKIIDRVNSLDDIIEYFYTTDLVQYMFAIFKEGTVPKHECMKNKFKLTYCRNGKYIDFCQFLRKCWETRIFEMKEVNGVFITSEKLSVWLNRECRYIEALKNYQVKFVVIKHQPDLATLNTEWTIGIFDANNFQHFDRVNGRDKFHATNSEEKLARIMNNFYHIKNDGDGIFLSSNILSEAEWRTTNPKNRFIFSRVTVPMDIGHRILRSFALNTVISIFPKFQNLYLSFCFYQNGNLETGIYLSGDDQFITKDSYNADEAAIIIGQKMKEIILEYCDPESDVTVTIKNSVPSKDADFTNPMYEYRTLIRI